MKATIYMLTWVSYTHSDDYIYSNVETFFDEQQARQQFDIGCSRARLECQWGAGWDGIDDMDDDEREEMYEYTVEESRDTNHYVVGSEAYEGYKVEITLERCELDIPVPPVKTENSILPAILFKEWDLRQLNTEFQNLLAEHEDDEPSVPGASHDEFEELRSGNPEAYGGEEDFNGECQYRAQILNAWDELCMRHPGLRDSGLSWWCGTDSVGFSNKWDLYIGTGDEQD